MKVKITYKIVSSHEEIDLEDYGHEEDVKWSDLSQEEKNEITDSLSEESHVIASGEDCQQTERKIFFG